MQADAPEASQSFHIAADLVTKADCGDAWAAPALQTLHLLRSMLDAKHQAALLPALLQLQHDDQVCQE